MQLMGGESSLYVSFRRSVLMVFEVMLGLPKYVGYSMNVKLDNIMPINTVIMKWLKEFLSFLYIRNAIKKMNGYQLWY